MLALLESHKAEIKTLCRGYNVKTLTIFGSAATGCFDDARSDIDMLVEFSDSLSAAEYASAFFSLHQDLEQLLNKKVDLLTPKSLSNPYFKSSVLASEQLFYAA